MALTKTHVNRGSGGAYSWIDTFYHPNVVPGIQQYGRGMPTFGGLWGNIFYVDDAGAGGTTGGFSPEAAVTTLDAANNLAVASNGDLVIALPGHNETIGAAAAWVCDIAGLTYIGLGRGANRPTLSFATATTADVDITAAAVTLCNFLCTNDLDAIAVAFVVTGADCAMLNMEWRDGTGNALVMASFSATADRPLIDGLFFTGSQTIGSGAGITNSVLVFIGNDNPVVRNSTIITRADIALIECRTTAVVRLEVYNCRLMNLDNRAAGTAGTAVEDVVTGSTGLIGPDLFIVLGADAANVTEAVASATFHFVDPIYIVNAVNEKAMLTNITASTDA